MEEIEEMAMRYAFENSGNILYTGKDMQNALVDAYIAGAKFIERNNEKEKV